MTGGPREAARLVSEARVSRSLLPWGFDVEYSLDGDCSPPQLSQLADRCLNGLLPAELFTEPVVVDLKGREPQDLLFEKIPAEFRPEGCEAVFVTGRIILEEQELDQLNDAESGERFALRLMSDFEDFPGASHIRYRLREERSGSLPAFIPFRAAAQVVPAVLDHLRIGLELFKTRFMTASLGFAPVAAERLLIDAGGGRFKLLLAAEGLRRRSQLPLEQHELFDRLNALLREVFEFDLGRDYAAKVGG